ncbi:hypothetical protein [Evansella tamaricis]|uniref:Uncharacterized protein n=1 Tax=Evansella tamaricis TaxID=2069301 RepID=A0ABS6JC37_9BACI|nr:hypothetical protein [Evansella tamaricis]MBU9711220.1 hypothetical protein [Evansella tamaricis]
MKLPSIKHADNEVIGSVIIVTSIVMILSAFFLPVVFLMVLQDIFFFSRSHWYFAAPPSAYFMFGAGMLWIPIILITFLSVKVWMENRDRVISNVWVYGLLLILSFPIFALSISNYYYFDDEGIHYSELFSFSEAEHSWDDIEKVIRVTNSEGGVSSVEEYIFILESGEELDVPFDTTKHEVRQIISRVIREYGYELIEQ